MATFNQVYTYTITAGGGTVNLDVTDNTTNIYVFSGTSTLIGNWVIQPTGSPTQGTEFDIRWQAPTTIGANSVTIFGTALTAAQALADLQISCYYNGSSWDVDIQEDGVQDIWEAGTGSNSAKLVNGGTSTASATGAINAGTNNTASGANSFTAGVGNTASGSQSTALGANNTASATNSVTIGDGNTATAGGAIAIGSDCDATAAGAQAFGDNTTASGGVSHAEGQDTLASGSYTHAGGIQSIAARYGQFSRSSGKEVSGNATDYTQFSKLTA